MQLSVTDNKDLFSREDTSFFKGIAVLILLFIHLFSEKRGDLFFSFIQLNGNPLLSYLTLPGQMVVSIFLILSGYGLTQSYQKNVTNGIVQNLKKSFIRIFKLMKLYWFIGILSGIAVTFGGYILIGDIYHNVFEMIIDLLGLAYLFNEPTLNTAWWYMTIIIIAYLLFPIGYRIVKSHPKPVFIGTNIVVFIFLIFFRHGRQAGAADFVIWIVPFIWGIYASEYHIFEKIRKSDMHKRIGRTIILCLLFIPLLLIKQILHTYVFDGYLAVIEIYMLLTLKDSLKINFLEKFLIYLGNKSYSIYLFHSIYILFFPQFVYWLKYPMLIFLYFLGVCILTDKIIMFLYNKMRRSI